MHQSRGSHAQLLIDFFNSVGIYSSSFSHILTTFQLLVDPVFLNSAEPWLRKYTLIILRKLCENSMLYPQTYVLNGIQNPSRQGGGGFCDIFRASCNGQLLCLKVIRLIRDSDKDKLLKVRDRVSLRRIPAVVLMSCAIRTTLERQSCGVNSTIPILYVSTAFFTLTQNSNPSASYPLGWKTATL